MYLHIFILDDRFFEVLNGLALEQNLYHWLECVRNEVSFDHLPLLWFVVVTKDDNTELKAGQDFFISSSWLDIPLKYDNCVGFM